MRSITNYSVQVVCTVFTQRLCLKSLTSEPKEKVDDADPEPEVKDTENGIAMVDVHENEKTKF